MARMWSLTYSFFYTLWKKKEKVCHILFISAWFCASCGICLSKSGFPLPQHDIFQVLAPLVPQAFIFLHNGIMPRCVYIPHLLSSVVSVSDWLLWLKLNEHRCEYIFLRYWFHFICKDIQQSDSSAFNSNRSTFWFPHQLYQLALHNSVQELSSYTCHLFMVMPILRGYRWCLRYLFVSPRWLSMMTTFPASLVFLKNVYSTQLSIFEGMKCCHDTMDAGWNNSEQNKTNTLWSHAWSPSSRAEESFSALARRAGEGRRPGTGKSTATSGCKMGRGGRNMLTWQNVANISLCSHIPNHHPVDLDMLSLCWTSIYFKTF